MAQNANRSGFFIEAGVGGACGNTPRTALLHQDGQVLVKYASGGVFDGYLGGRFRTSNHWAFDIRLGAQAAFSALKPTLTIKAMPGMRYTSNELFGNVSLYGALVVGGAFGFGYGLCGSVIPENGEYKLDDLKHRWHLGTDYEQDDLWGVSYMIAVGLNVTTHFYAGLLWDGQYMFALNQGTIFPNPSWGMLGVQLGYRF